MTEMMSSPDEPMWGTLGVQGFDEVPLCVHCLHPARPDAHFCKRCLAPLSSYAAFGFMGRGNYESIWSTGWILYQATVTRRPRVLHVVVMALVFLPELVLMGVSSSMFYPPQSLFASGHVLEQLIFLPMFGLWLYIALGLLWKTWRNYWGQRHRDLVEASD